MPAPNRLPRRAGKKSLKTPQIGAGTHQNLTRRPQRPCGRLSVYGTGLSSRHPGRLWLEVSSCHRGHLMTLRDIRRDLAARLDDVTEERKVVAERLRFLEAREQSIRAMLDSENQMYLEADTDQETLPIPGTIFPGTIRDFVLLALRGGGPLHLAEIKRLAGEHRLSVDEGASLGRILHGALIGLKKDGMVGIVSPSVWQLTDHTSEVLEEDDDALFRASRRTDHNSLSPKGETEPGGPGSVHSNHLARIIHAWRPI